MHEPPPPPPPLTFTKNQKSMFFGFLLQKKAEDERWCRTDKSNGVYPKQYADEQ
jgi:hypothetical protein